MYAHILGQRKHKKGSMDNQKLENLLNLALDTPLAQREKSENLNVGYEETTRSWELIVKYNGDLLPLSAAGIGVEELIFGYAILNVPEALIDTVAALPQIEYVEKPKRLFFAVTEGKAASCILPVTIREPYLDGSGVLVAVIDSGIDYTNLHFRNADGSSRILYLWDQTIPPDESLDRYPPEGFLLGTEFDKAQIDRALAASPAERYRLLPSVDVSGHGTAVAGIAAGSNRDGYGGVAPASGLLVVKLGLAGSSSFPRTTELMRALTYAVKKAQELNMPLSVNLSFGNTYGAHDGTSLLERFLDNISEVGRTVISVGSGNEGAAAGHVQGVIAGGVGNTETIELSVAAYETSLSVQFWKHYVDSYRIRLRSPGGEEEELPIDGFGSRTLRMEGTTVLVYIGEPTPYAVNQEIYFDLLPDASYLTPGVWSFAVETLKSTAGQYYFYLPSAGVRGTDTRFFAPSPQVTLTIPSTAGKVITVGAYDVTYDAYADFSGRGYTYPERSLGLLAAGAVKPDLAAPGVGIIAPDTYGGYAAFTGTSFATPFVAGSAALLMEWGIVRGNDPFLYGEKVKAYLRKGARPLRGETVYPNERVGFGGLCLRDSLPT